MSHLQIVCEHCNIIHEPFEIPDILIFMCTHSHDIIGWNSKCTNIIFSYKFSIISNYNITRFNDHSYDKKIIKKYILLYDIMDNIIDINGYIRTMFVNTLIKLYYNYQGIIL